MHRIIKQASGLAIFAFIFVTLAWLIAISSEWISLGYRITCRLPAGLAGAGAFLGILALLVIWKKKYKGRWFAILAIIFGLFGYVTLVCCC